MRTRMKKLNMIHYAQTQEQRKRLLEDGYVDAPLEKERDQERSEREEKPRNQKNPKNTEKPDTGEGEGNG